MFRILINEKRKRFINVRFEPHVRNQTAANNYTRPIIQQLNSCCSFPLTADTPKKTITDSDRRGA